MAETRRINIGIGLDAEGVDVGAVRASQAFERLRASLRTVKKDAQDTGKSMEQLGRNFEQDSATRAKLAKELEDLTKRYEAGEKAAERDAEAQAKLSQQMSKLEEQIKKKDRALEDNKVSQYAYELRELDNQVRAVTEATEREVAALRISGDAAEATTRAHRGAEEIMRLQQQRVEALGRGIARSNREMGEGSNVTARLSAAYNTASEEMVQLRTKVDQYNESMDDGKGKAENFLSAIVGTEVGYKQIGQSLTQNVTKPLIAFGKAAIEAAMETESMEAMFDQVFQKSAGSMRGWSQNLADSLGASEYRIREMMGTQKAMFEGMELPAKKQQEMIEGITERVYDMAAMYNTDVATAFDKFTSGLTGSSMPLREFGIIITETAVKQHAWAEGIAQQGKELTEQEKVMARYSLIMKQSAQTQGQWTREADEGSGQTKILMERIDTLTKKIGAALLPIFEKVLGVVAKVVEWFSKLDEGSLLLATGILGIAAALGPMLTLFAQIKQIQMAGALTQMLGPVSALGGAVGSTLLPKLAMLAAIIAAIAVGLWALKQLFTDTSQAASTSNIGDVTKDMQAAQDSFKQPVGRNARGTKYWRGGLTWVGEERPELVELPQGTRILDGDQSRRMAGAGGSGITIQMNVNANEINEVQKLLSTVRHLERTTRQR